MEERYIIRNALEQIVLDKDEIYNLVIDKAHDKTRDTDGDSKNTEC